MAAPEHVSSPGGGDAQGFEGSVSNLGLADIIQLEGQNRLSGSISVAYEGREGSLFLQAGELVHAEAGELRGEAAVYEILSWPTGSFGVHPNVATFGRTIQKNLSHLLLEAHRRMDEAGRAPRPPAPPAPPPAPPAARQEQRPVPTIAEKVRAVPGVAYAVVLDKNGASVGDASPAAEALAANGFYLASMIARPIADALGLGELVQATVSSPAEKLLLFHSRSNYLGVTVAAGASLPDTEAGVRRALGLKTNGR